MKYKTVPFDVIEVWNNDYSRPFSFTPDSPKSEKCFAIKIGDDVFHLGDTGMGLHICPDLDTPTDDDKSDLNAKVV